MTNEELKNSAEAMRVISAAFAASADHVEHGDFEQAVEAMVAAVAPHMPVIKELNGDELEVRVLGPALARIDALAEDV